LNVKKTAIISLSQIIEQNISIGEYAAISTIDKKADGGYYLVQWTSTPFTSQSSRRIGNGIIEEGAAVCDGVYLLHFAKK
jgi:hypothetical protein